jgi:hypothetical protein
VRKPLILVRAILLGIIGLLPRTGNPEQDPAIVEGSG